MSKSVEGNTTTYTPQAGRTGCDRHAAPDNGDDVLSSLLPDLPEDRRWDVLATAYHEAGHALTAMAAGVTVEAAAIKTVPGNDHPSGWVDSVHTESFYIDAAVTVAGTAAVNLITDSKDQLEDDDQERLDWLLAQASWIDPLDIESRIGRWLEEPPTADALKLGAAHLVARYGRKVNGSILLETVSQLTPWKEIQQRFREVVLPPEHRTGVGPELQKPRLAGAPNEPNN